MRRLFLMLMILALAIPSSVSAAPNASATVPGGPTFWVHNVERNKSVTISVSDYPKGDKRYRVELGRIGNAFSPIVVGELNGDDGKAFTKTFDIPGALRNESHLAIQLVDVKTLAVGYDIFANADNYNTNVPLTLVPISQSSAQSANGSVEIFLGPTFWVQDVDVSSLPYEVTLRFSNYTTNDRFQIFIGHNTKDFEALPLGDVDGTYGRSFSVSFDLPSGLWDDKGSEIMIRAVNVINGNSGTVAVTLDQDWKNATPYGLYSTRFVDAAAALKARTGSPYTRVLNVVKDTEITIQTFNFPANKVFTVTMGRNGSYGIGGFTIGDQPTGEGYSFVATYPIPPQLRGEDLITIRFQSTDSGHYAYDTFENVDGYSAFTSGYAASDPDLTLPEGTYPYFIINSVVKDTTVTISGFNFTKNDSYTVRMGPIGTLGVGGAVAGQYETDDEGTFTATFDIPASLVGQAQISIRLESARTDYYAYNFFWNQ